MEGAPFVPWIGGEVGWFRREEGQISVGPEEVVAVVEGAPVGEVGDLAYATAAGYGSVVPVG